MSEKTTWLAPTAPRSISDDDLCSGCKRCDYKPGEESGCELSWPGHFAISGPREGYCVSCPKFEPKDADEDALPPACECDNTHEANDTVCRWCWAHGRRHWNDPEVAA